jgi:energy-coupling factor transporter ATP-binding protein EcfA2
MPTDTFVGAMSEGLTVNASALLFEDFKTSYEKSVATTFTLTEYLAQCRDDPMAYALAPERIIKAIGEPRLVQTKSDPRLLRLYGNRTLKYYDAFADVYGMEGGVIDEIVSFYRHAAQGLEERKQVLYLLGPVGSAKSTLAITLKSLMEHYPIYVLVDGDTGLTWQQGVASSTPVWAGAQTYCTSLSLMGNGWRLPSIQELNTLVDEGTFFELKTLFARELVTGFARLEGRAVGIVANQPKWKGGVLFVDSADKAARFIWLCDAFNVPLLFLADVPGFMVGTAVERQGIIRHGAKMISAISEATVPKLCVVVRKAYGAGLYAMAGPGFEPDATIALPTAKIAVMGAEAAVNAVYANKIAALGSDEERSEFIARSREEYERDIDIVRLASELVVDDIVTADARSAEDVGTALQQLRASAGRLDGVVFAAGTKSRHLLRDHSTTDFDTHVTRRLQMLRALADALGDADIGFCAVVSSLASLLGGPGLAPYAAGHAAAEAFVAERARSGHPWVAVACDNWVTRAERGLAEALLRSLILSTRLIASP